MFYQVAMNTESANIESLFLRIILIPYAYRWLFLKYSIYFTKEKKWRSYVLNDLSEDKPLPGTIVEK